MMRRFVGPLLCALLTAEACGGRSTPPDPPAPAASASAGADAPAAASASADERETVLADADADGIPDIDDRCPDEAEAADAGERDGCPDPRDTIAIICAAPIPGLHFGPGSPGALVDGASGIIDRVAEILLGYPELGLELVGHADPGEGRSERERAARSLARAEHARDLLVGRGVAEERLGVAGMGAHQPVDPGRSDEARARNRRVEFKVIPPAE